MQKYYHGNVIIFKMSVFMLLVPLLLVGCTTTNHQEDQTVKLISVSVFTEPESPMPNEEIKLIAKVMQGEEAVNDALEVQFELWQNGTDEHEFIKAELEDNGEYVIRKTFEEEDVYHVIPHVSARDMHVMPHETIAIGNVNLDEVEIDHSKSDYQGHYDNPADYEEPTEQTN